MSSDHRIVELYRDYSGKLRNIMQSRFGIPDAETENLLHDVFASLLSSTTPIENVEKWLIGAVCNRSRMFWRSSHTSSVPADDHAGHEELDENMIFLEDVLGRLPERASEVLRLRYLEGWSGKEIAQHYGTSVNYTNVLIHRSMKRARELARGSKR